MHTIKRQNENEWMVGNVERGEHADEFVPMFAGLSLLSAVRMVNVLNGGTGEVNVGASSSVLEQLWEKASGKETWR